MTAMLAFLAGICILFGCLFIGVSQLGITNFDREVAQMFIAPGIVLLVVGTTIFIALILH